MILIFLGVAPMYVEIEREKAISLSLPLYKIHSILAIKHPEDAISITTFTDPLNLLSWFVFGVFCIIMAIVLTITLHTNQQQEEIEDHSLVMSLAVVFKALMQRGWNSIPKKFSSRIVLYR